MTWQQTKHKTNKVFWVKDERIFHYIFMVSVCSFSADWLNNNLEFTWFRRQFLIIKFFFSSQQVFQARNALEYGWVLQLEGLETINDVMSLQFIAIRYNSLMNISSNTGAENKEWGNSNNFARFLKFDILNLDVYKIFSRQVLNSAGYTAVTKSI